MGINCPSCGGKMLFDIASQQLICSYCDTQTTIQDYKAQNEAEEQKMTYDTVLFTCKNCGAELTAPDEQTVAYCSYCGSEQMMMAKHEETLRPKTIIPFKKTKEEAMKEYANALKGKLYVPKEFKDPKFLDGFRGIYLPYFSYSVLVKDGNVSLAGEKHYTSGSYDYDEDYEVYASVGGRTQSVNFDASAAFDDTLANEIAPFQAEGLKDFHEGYLAGFYADKVTSSGSTYLKAAEEIAVNDVYDEIGLAAGDVDIKKEKSLAEDKAKLGIAAVDVDVSYFPVWFLTWRNKKRVAYSVMNGQTGKITLDIPVNKKMFFLVSLIAAIVVFGILSILPMFILPKSLCSIAAIILVISGLLLSNEIKKIYEFENHIYDYGDTSSKEEKKTVKAKQADGNRAERKKTQSKGSGKWITWAIIGAVVLYFMITSFASGSVSGLLSRSYVVVFVIALVGQGVLSVLTITKAVKIEKKTAIIPAVFSVIVLLAGIIVRIINSPFDAWYYGAALACLAGVILNCLSAINYFNYLTTRPVPNFFRREGANNEK